MENQRNEDYEPTDGGLPQPPAGFVQILDVLGSPPSGWSLRPVALPVPLLTAAGLDTPEDAEPEYVSINSRNKVALTLQENNGVAIIDLKKGVVENVFTAGAVTLTGVDAVEDGFVSPVDTLTGVVREPDAVGWIDDRYLATANEGDWKGGSRGWTVFDSKTGNVVWDAGSTLEDLAIKHGLHNDDRSGNKGVEIEGLGRCEVRQDHVCLRRFGAQQLRRRLRRLEPDQAEVPADPGDRRRPGGLAGHPRPQPARGLQRRGRAW